MGNRLAATGDGILLIQTSRNEVRGNSVIAIGTFGDPGTFGVGLLIDAGSSELVAATPSRTAGDQGPTLRKSS